MYPSQTQSLVGATGTTMAFSSGVISNCYALASHCVCSDLAPKFSCQPLWPITVALSSSDSFLPPEIAFHTY